MNFRHIADGIDDGDDIWNTVSANVCVGEYFRHATSAIFLIVVETVQGREVVLDYWNVVDVHALINSSLDRQIEDDTAVITSSTSVFFSRLSSYSLATWLNFFLAKLTRALDTR